MPRVTLTNNFGHHLRARITKDRIIFDQNKVAKITEGHGRVGVNALPVAVDVAAGGSSQHSEERNKIHHLELKNPGYTILDAGKRVDMAYSKNDTAYLTIEINKNGEYVIVVDQQEMDSDQSSELSVTEKGSIEKTKKAEKYFGVGRNHHQDHDPSGAFSTLMIVNE